MPDVILRTLVALSCCLVLGACGQRGPLYLPQPSANPATASPTNPPADARSDANDKKPSPSATPQP